MHDSSRLPGPISTLWEWQYRGSCLGMDSSVFLPSRRRERRFPSTRNERAKAICQDCPVLEECRDHALSTREPYGVWGGMSEEERRAYYEQQARRFANEPA